MKVDDVMTKVLAVCTPRTDLAVAARRMQKRNCGVLPVIDKGNQVVGILTDRDIAIAVGRADAKPSKMLARTVMSTPVRTCRPSDTVRKALHTMEKAHVRRLPVIGPDGVLVGIISIDDVVMISQNSGGGGRISYKQAIAVLDSICERTTLPVPRR